MGSERGLTQTASFSLPKGKPAEQRLGSIDAVRGLAMVFMALDHVRFFFPIRGVVVDPTNLGQTTIPLFLTRWVTHFCAPAFVFLAGIAVFLSMTNSHKTKQERSRFLVKRGLWLLLLEFTVVNFAFSFEFPPRLLIAQVIWALGLSFIGLSFLVYLKPSVVGLLGLLALALQPLAFEFLHRKGPDFYPALWALFIGRKFEFGPGLSLSIKYPIMPWLGLIMAGYGFGKMYLTPSTDRKKILIRLGTALITSFTVIRLFAVHLHAPPVSDFKTAFIWFLNCEKYPPSFLFILMTMGPVLLLLALFEDWRPRIAQPLVRLGKAPLFYYLLHIPLAHMMFIACELIRTSPPVLKLFPPRYWGYILPLVFAVWIMEVIFLYPLCAWFEQFKAKNKQALWARYL